MIDKSSFIGGNGVFFTRQLFWEQAIELPEGVKSKEPIFTLHKDKPGLINFGKRYVELRDPTGYKISQELLYSYDHWRSLLNSKWFLVAKELWDQELDALIQSEALDVIRTQAKEGQPAQALAAAKYLANKDYRKDKKDVGRPLKRMVDAEVKKMADQERDIQDDFSRIRLVSGGK